MEEEKKELLFFGVFFLPSPLHVRELGCLSADKRVPRIPFDCAPGAYETVRFYTTSF